jgi:hypothetical protein
VRPVLARYTPVDVTKLLIGHRVSTSLSHQELSPLKTFTETIDTVVALHFYKIACE